jgi:hypothetical protein
MAMGQAHPYPHVPLGGHHGRLSHQSRQQPGCRVNQPGPGTLIVDANAFLISESGGDGANLAGSWTAIINGTVEGFGGSEGMKIQNSTNAITIGRTGDVLSSTTALHHLRS